MNITSLVDVKSNPNIPTLAPGDTVKVSIKVIEGAKERTQVFQGVVIRVRNSGAGSSFTVRRVAYGVGVERTFPLYSPTVEKVEVTQHGKVRRAKLYYLRGLSAKKARIKEKRPNKEKKPQPMREQTQTQEAD
jgi:large subunit ribosomal protein L19